MHPESGRFSSYTPLDAPWSHMDKPMSLFHHCSSPTPAHVYRYISCSLSFKKNLALWIRWQRKRARALRPSSSGLKSVGGWIQKRFPGAITRGRRPSVRRWSLLVCFPVGRKADHGNHWKKDWKDLGYKQGYCGRCYERKRRENTSWNFFKGLKVATKQCERKVEFLMVDMDIIVYDSIEWLIVSVSMNAEYHSARCINSKGSTPPYTT